MDPRGAESNFARSITRGWRPDPISARRCVADTKTIGDCGSSRASRTGRSAKSITTPVNCGSTTCPGGTQSADGSSDVLGAQDDAGACGRRGSSSREESRLPNQVPADALYHPCLSEGWRGRGLAQTGFLCPALCAVSHATGAAAGNRGLAPTLMANCAHWKPAGSSKPLAEDRRVTPVEEQVVRYSCL